MSDYDVDMLRYNFEIEKMSNINYTDLYQIRNTVKNEILLDFINSHDEAERIVKIFKKIAADSIAYGYS